MSGTRRFWLGNVSADSTQFNNSMLCRTWFGLESASGRPTYARYITDLTPTNHILSVAELRPTRPRTLPDKTDTTPTYNRQFVGEISFKHVWKISPRQIVCPNINRHQTDKTESIPTVNRSLPEFDDFCRFCVGLAGVTGGCLLWGFNLDLLISTRIDCIQGPFTYKDAVLPVWETHCGD